MTFRAVVTDLWSGYSTSSDTNVVLIEPVPISMRQVASIIGGVGFTVFVIAWKIYVRFFEKKKPPPKDDA